MDDFDLEIKREFINEALMNLEEAEGSFMELEGSADPKPLLDKIFRLAHNLKGGSRAVGFGDVAEFTHQLENLVQKIQRSEVALSSDVVTTLLRSNDRLVEMLSELKGNLEAKFNNADLLTEIQGWLSGQAQAQPQASVPVVEAAPEPVEVIPEVAAEVVTEVVADVVAESAPADLGGSEPPPTVPDANAFFATEDKMAVTPPVSVVAAPRPNQMPNQPQAAKAPAGGDDEVIRVNLSRIDQLNDFVGELIVIQSVVQQQAVAGQGTKMQASLRQLMKLSKDIQSMSMSLRMLPVKPLIQKLQRVVRDTAKALSKEVAFDVLGDQMEIDKSVLDRLADPLIHILRNAVDHGLETPQDRREKSKNPEGRVTLSFTNEGNHLVVIVKDDGKGINTEILRKKAIEKKLISASQSLTEKQLIHLIFHPGFSTKTETSEISGRGVGMDVVKTNVEKIGGQVDVLTTLGQGSVFRLQIPLSLAVIEGIVVQAESGRYVLPLSQIQETINLRTQKLFKDKLGIGSCFELRGDVVPLFTVDETLGSKPTAEVDGTALIVRVEDRPMGFVVKDILRAQQIVVKPLTNGIVPKKGWVGSCVLGDGLPTLILSPVDLLAGRVRYGLTETAQTESAITENGFGGAA